MRGGLGTAASSPTRRASRAQRRASAAGFTLMELMVVVVLVAILAMLATPAMRRSRDDKVAFDYARQVQLLVNRARVRAAARGGAQLLVMEPGGGDSRGRFVLFEALDGAPVVEGGPNPRSDGCTLLGQWNDLAGWVPGAAPTPSLRAIEGLDLNTPGVNVDANIRAELRVANALTPALAYCVTPGGKIYVGVGGSGAAAVANMQSQAPFFGTIEATISRNGGLGIRRRVLVAGSAAARIQSR